MAEILGIKTNEELEDLYRFALKIPLKFLATLFLGKLLGTLRHVQRNRELPTTISSSQLLTQRKCSSQSLSSGPHCCCGTCVTKSLFCSLLNSLDLDENTKAVLVENIQRKLTQQAVKIRADFECSCFTYEGIDAVKEALRAGMHIAEITLCLKALISSWSCSLTTEQCSPGQREEGWEDCRIDQ